MKVIPNHRHLGCVLGVQKVSDMSGNLAETRISHWSLIWGVYKLIKIIHHHWIGGTFKEVPSPNKRHKRGWESRACLHVCWVIRDYIKFQKLAHRRINVWEPYCIIFQCILLCYNFVFSFKWIKKNISTINSCGKRNKLVHKSSPECKKWNVWRSWLPGGRPPGSLLHMCPPQCWKANVHIKH